MSDIEMLCFYFHGHCIGLLKRAKTGYTYLSNVDLEHQLWANLSKADYTLWNSEYRYSKRLPREFVRLIQEHELIEEAQIQPEDSDWEILIKISFLDHPSLNFYVQQVGKMLSENVDGISRDLIE